MKTFGSIEDIYKTLEEKGEEYFIEKGAKKRMVKLLREGKEDAEFSKILATIRRDAPIRFKLPSSSWLGNVDVEKVIQFFQKYEFHSLPQRFLKTLEKQGLHTERDEVVRERVDEVDARELSLMLHLIDSDYIEPSIDEVFDYTGTTTEREARDKLLEELKSMPKVYDLYRLLEKPLIPIVKKMEENGILVDRDFFEKLSQEYSRELKNLEEKIFSLVGEEFNINSPKQVSEILFEKLKLSTKGIKKSKTGAYSTKIDNLEKLRDESEVVPLIIEYRELQKLLSTYIEVIPTMIGSDGRLHAEFLQNGTATGRFSSRNPNLQNIPTRTELGRKIREGFIAPEGKMLVSFDYSQIELRILAILSGDEELKRIFQEGKDIHTAVAARIAGVSEDEVDREMRRKAKIVNFGILYGMGINSLKKEMESTKEEAQKFYQGFFREFPKATQFLEETKRFAHEHGYTETLFGRRRQFKNINAKLPFIRAMAERMALNAPIQGTAADIIKSAMLSLDGELEKNFPNTKLLLQIHDELIYEVPDDEKDAFIEKGKKDMEDILEKSYIHYKTDVPLLVHASSGKHWGELK